MAFGYHKAKREREASEREANRLRDERRRLQETTPYYGERIQNAASNYAQDFRQARQEGREQGRAYGEQVLNRDVQGLTPAQRRSMEESGQRKLGRDVQGYQRQLRAQQGQRGVRGGAAYAQEADLARAGMEAQQQFMRDLEQLDADVALKKLGAQFGIEQGEAAQTQLDRQLALDMARMEEERQRQRGYENQYHDYFTRV